uniref:Uncharacterized protein n=1 Tax=Glossina brevipalpis TaxID=37001 RepID=A0A1A9WHD8_9MUSC
MLLKDFYTCCPCHGFGYCDFYYHYMRDYYNAFRLSALLCSALVWFGLVWSGVAWPGLVWSSLVWSGLQHSSHRHHHHHRHHQFSASISIIFSLLNVGQRIFT